MRFVSEPNVTVQFRANQREIIINEPDGERIAQDAIRRYNEEVARIARTTPDTPLKLENVGPTVEKLEGGGVRISFTDGANMRGMGDCTKNHG